MNPNIQEKQNFTHKNSSVDYDDMLLPLTKICRVENKFCPFIKWHSGKLWRHHFQDQYQMVCLIGDSSSSIQNRFITIWVFTYSMDYLHHHKYKLYSSHSKWTRYMPIILSSIYLGQIQTTVTRNQRHYLLTKITWSNLHLNKESKLEGAASSYVNGIYISTHLNTWCCLLHRWNDHAFQRSPCRQKRIT